MSNQGEIETRTQSRSAHLINAIAGGGLFMVAAGIMSYIQFNPDNPYLVEFDSYYHVKMAELIRDHGILHTFPWLQYTILRDHYVDLHFLFHILLIPFVTGLGPILGAKVFVIVVVSLSFLLLYLFLKKYELHGAAWFTLFALFTMSWTFYLRMSSIRDISLSLLLLMAGIYAIAYHKKWWAGIICGLYVWAYGGFVFLPIFALIYFIAQILMGERPQGSVVLAVFVGMALGLLINPYFPDYFRILYAHLFPAGLGAKSTSAKEWAPIDTWSWVQFNYIPALVLFGGIVIALINHLKQNAKSVAVFIFTLFFLALTWKSRRFVEYSSFFMPFSGFLLVKDFVDKKRDEWRRGGAFKKIDNWVYASAVAILMPLSIGFAKSEITQARNYTVTLFSMSALLKAHGYLLENAQDGDIVFTDAWDVFPRYFFVNSKTYYIVGLDPEFLNEYEGPPFEGEKGRLYDIFVQISSGADGSNLERIRDVFHAKWVIVNIDHPQFYQNLKEQPRLFQEVLFATNNIAVDDYLFARNDGYHLFKVL